MKKRKNLGQHFLKSKTIAESIVSSAEITRNDVVLEIGTGYGILTPYLCKNAKQVFSIENDQGLYLSTKSNFHDYLNLVLEYGDGFNSAHNFSIFISNLPYSKSRFAVEWLLGKKFLRAVIMVQKEFAEKLTSKEEHKAISVLANYGFKIKFLMNVKKSNFFPTPKVDSTVILLEKKRVISKVLIPTVNRIFSYRRKTVQNILKQFGLNSTSRKRLDELSGDEIIKIHKKLSEAEPYPPSEDTLFLADYIKNESGEFALDIGTGSGYLAAILEKSFSLVVGTDLIFNVLKKQEYFATNNVCCNGADAINQQFDLVICNMPYLNTDDVSDVRTDGGKDGLEIPIKIIDSAKSRIKLGGKFVYVTSSLSDFKKLISYTKLEGFDVSILAKKKLFFEELILVKAVKLLP